MDYDILKIIDDMELDFIDRIRRHEQKYIELGCEDWKRMQLREIKAFKEECKDMIQEYYKAFEDAADYNLIQEYEKSWKNERKRILKADNPVFNVKLMQVDPRSNFHKVNKKRMIKMINAVNNDFSDACFSLYRQSEDIYRKLIFKSTAMVNSGSYDLLTAINAANKEMLANGVETVPYRSKETGEIVRKVTVRAYCEMALRTNGVRAAIAGQGMIRDYLEIYTVRVSDHQSSCPKCGVWQRKILIDDVYSKGEPDGKHELLSSAIEQGLLHPNCRHILATYTEGVDDDYGDREYTEEDKKRYQAEQKQREHERNIRKLKREAAGTVEGNKKIKEEQEKLKKHLQNNPLLKRKPWRENN